MGNGDNAILWDHMMSTLHSNRLPLIHHVDEADGFTDPSLITHQYVVFPENRAEAESAILLAQ